MKAILTSLCILCFAITSAQNFDAGLIGGFCTSQVSGDNLSGYNKLGSRFGAYINYPINKKMSYQLEMQFLQKTLFPLPYGLTMKKQTRIITI